MPDVPLTQVIYREDFESGELRAWASYPPCQDTAYDPFLYPGKIKSTDSGTCLVAQKIPRWNRDQLLGAVKLLDLILDRDSSIRFRYYLKTVETSIALEVHLPLITRERLVYAVPEPQTNRWVDVRIGWEDLTRFSFVSPKEESIRITAIVIQAKVVAADTDMPIYLGLDDIEIAAKCEQLFDFIKPEVAILTEWEERIPLKHYHPGDNLIIEGRYNFIPERVTMALTSFTSSRKTLYKAALTKTAEGTWRNKALNLDRDLFPYALYRGTITAETNDTIQSTTHFTFFVVNTGIGTQHPRLWFDEHTLQGIKERLNTDRFRPILERYCSRAAEFRKEISPERVEYDFDQFPIKDWLASFRMWFVDSIVTYREAISFNAIAFFLGGDSEAGRFCKEMLLQLAGWPQWNHPWMENRGFHTYFPVGEFADAFALGYDLTYDLMTDGERRKVREGLLRNFVKPAHKTYVEQNQITSNTSNWISHIAGGSLVAQIAIYGDDPEFGDLEPWFTGMILKEFTYIQKVFGCDGSYGEGYRYYNFAMQSFSKILPTLNRVFGVDLSGPIENSYRETLSAGIICENVTYTFGDSDVNLKEEVQDWWIASQSGPMTNWVWLLARYRDPVLSWLYHNLKSFDTFQEILHYVDDIPQKPPETLGNVMFFRDVGTAVFKSGWGSNDFVFVFRSGPFYNHQHLDQGTFYLADHGHLFLEERYDGKHLYYDDPVYQSHAIQPISHNTILLNGNPQSQKVGDSAGFSNGLGDQAIFEHWIDTDEFACAVGRLGGVYQGVVKGLRRFVLYIKPRTILLVDEITPYEEDVEVNLLFHTRWKKDITLHDGYASFRKDGSALYLFHLNQKDIQRQICYEPHFLYQYKERPLRERGYLEITGQTRGRRLVIANLMTAASDGVPPDVKITAGEGYNEVFCRIDGITTDLTVNTSDEITDKWGLSTDALILARGEKSQGIFMAGGTYLKSKDKTLLLSEKLLVAYLTPERNYVVYHLSEQASVSLNVTSKPKNIRLNGEKVKTFAYDSSTSTVRLPLPGGMGTLEINS